MTRSSSLRAVVLFAAAAFTAACGDDTPNQDPDVGVDAGDVAADAHDTSDAADETGGDVPDGEDAETSPDVIPIEWCDGSVAHRYDPLVAEELLLFPDDVFTVADADSTTGRRISLTAEHAPWIAEIPSLLGNVAEDMGTLSGFSTNGAVVLRFDASVTGFPATAEEALTGETVQLFDLSVDPPERVPFEYESLDEGRDALLWPLRPLALGAQHALILTQSLTADDGSCVRPSPFTQDVLQGRTSDGAPLSDRAAALREEWMRALDVTGVSPEDVTGMTTFTVHDDLGPLVAAANDVRTSGFPELINDATCAPFQDTYRECELQVRAHDYRIDGWIQTGAPQDEWVLNVTLWLPDGEEPAPLIMFGHGLNGERESGDDVAKVLLPLGAAVVAVDAMNHGEHPTAPNDLELAALTFLGIDLGALHLDALALRGNFDQSNLDRLQVLRALMAATDVDGDGVDDLDPERVGYWGISLGGMLGSGLAAISSELDAVVLSVAGGRLLSFATDTSEVADYLPLLVNILGSEELFRRLVPVAQVVVDPADPATLARHILDGSLHDGTGPSVLFPVALKDETVPPETGFALARALGAPQIGEAFEPLDVIEQVEAPLQGNITASGTTAAYMQYDRVERRGSIVSATHGNMPLSAEAKLQATRFLTTWMAGETPEIIDPYVSRETPPLVEE